jgi:hypothetical protein
MGLISKSFSSWVNTLMSISFHAVRLLVDKYSRLIKLIELSFNYLIPNHETNIERPFRFCK